MPLEQIERAAHRADLDALIAALQERGLIAAADSRHATQLCRAAGAPLDVTLSNLGLVSEDALADFYADYFRLARYEGAPRDLAADAPAGLSPRFLERRRVFPLARSGATAAVAIVDPTDSEAIEGVAFALGADVAPVVATATQMDALLATLRAAGAMADGGGEPDLIAADSDAAKLKDMASAEPVVRLVGRLLTEASGRRASDVHIEPKERRTLVRYRIDGVLHDQRSLSKAEGLAVVSRLKILANLDIAERRRPQDGRLTFPVAGRPVDLRVSTTPTIFGESVVVRLLEKSTASLALSDLGFEPDIADGLRRLIARPNGIVLLTGPTGSGKTTTLYALLELLARKECKILTVEDPVEYQIDGVSQTQVNPAIGLDFANAMRSFLRHDPDVIMVGEMRDLETARTAVQAALTGHLVLSTLHTNDAPSAVTRLLDMGVDDYLVASTLLGVVAQRLVRRCCGACAGAPSAIDPCPSCAGTGYCGRVAVCEILIIDDELRALIQRGVTASRLKRSAEERGFAPLGRNGVEKIAAGVTDTDEVRRVLGS